MALALLAGLLFAAPSGSAPAGATPHRAKAAVVLPDSVIARLPNRDLTAREVLDSWNRLDPNYRPKGQGLEVKHAFLQQLIEKEAIALAANAEPFVMTDVESAQFLAVRADAVRRGLYRRLVADSTVITDADRDTARTRMTSTPTGKPVPEDVIEANARTLAEDRRATLVNDRIRVSLAPAWDDSALAFLARRYTMLDPSTPDLSHPMSMRLPERRPELSPADSGRALGTSTVGPLSMGEFVRRFSMLNPFQSPLPTTPGAIQARGEQFLGQIWFDREAEREEVLKDPRVVAQMANKRESIALDHYYARHVLARIDTSEVKLRERYKKTPERYAIPSHSLILAIPTADSSAADSVLSQLRAGTPWDTLCARRAPPGADPASCNQPSPLPDTFADSALVRAVRARKPGEIGAHSFTSAGFPPGAWLVFKMVEYVPHRLRTFEEARGFAARDVAAEQSETLLRAELNRLTTALPVTRNEPALARLDFGPARQ